MVFIRLQSTGTSTSGTDFGNVAEYSGTKQTYLYPTTTLLDLPTELLDKIFSYLDYKTVSQLRPVCKQMNRVCSAILNSAFQKLRTKMLHRFQNNKSKMPRRVSLRSKHPLACENDIIGTVHMRLNSLQISFGKHIERKHICFFPGEILDEVNRILRYIEVPPNFARPYKVTEELFDLSTMAMEYFEDHIEPSLPAIVNFGEDESPAITLQKKKAHPKRNTILFRKRICKIKQGMKRHTYQLSQLRKNLHYCRGKIVNQQKQIVEYAARLDEHDKKTEEANRKFSTMLQELNKCKTELQYWRSKSSLTSSASGSCGEVTVAVADQFAEDAVNQGVNIVELEPAASLFQVPSTSSEDG